MLSVSPQLFEVYGAYISLVFLRILGFFISCPLYSTRGTSIVLRVYLALTISVIFGSNLINAATPQLDGFNPGSKEFIVELCIGLTAGFLVRLGILVVDVAAQIVSFQSGYSFASAHLNDANLSSGVIVQFITLTSLALLFASNAHTAFIEPLLLSLKSGAPGQWPSAWGGVDLISSALQRSFEMGVLLGAPLVTIYIFFNLLQAVISKVTPQLNLFAVGFSVLAPLTFLMLTFVIISLLSTLEKSMDYIMLSFRALF